MITPKAESREERLEAEVTKGLLRLSTSPVSLDAQKNAARLRLALKDNEAVVGFVGIGSEDKSARLAFETAIALSQIDEAMVLFVDANIVTSVLRGNSEADQSPGLLGVIEGTSTVNQSLIASDIGNLYLLSSGSADGKEAGLMASVRCKQALAGFAGRFRYVIVNAGEASNPASMGTVTSCDALVLAVKAGLRRREELASLVRSLESLKARVLGVVLTLGE